MKTIEEISQHVTNQIIVARKGEPTLLFYSSVQGHLNQFRKKRNVQWNYDLFAATIDKLKKAGFSFTME